MVSTEISTKPPENMEEIYTNNFYEKSTIIETSITSTYRDWDLDRIIKDAISNHIDSGYAKVLARTPDGIVKLRDIGDTAIDEIIFEDNGTGFTYELLSLLYSTKKMDLGSIGQFGEGIKLLSSACVNQELGLMLESRDWQARPYFKEVIIDGNQIQQLCYNISQKEYGQTRTIFSNITPEFVDLCKKLPDKILQLSNRLPLVRQEMGEIYSPSSPKRKFFVKGIHVQDSESALLDYNIISDNINPDRNNLRYDVLEEIVEILLSKAVTNDEICKIVIDGNRQKSTLELGVMKRRNHLAADMFRTAYGRDAVLYNKDSRHGTNSYSKSLGLNVVEINNPHLFKILKMGGIKDTNQIYYEKVTKRIVLQKQDLTERDYEDFLWSHIFLSYSASKMWKYIQTIPKLEFIVEVENIYGLRENDSIFITSKLLNERPPEGETDLEYRDKLGTVILHELGHWVTDADHGEFTAFPQIFIEALAKEYTNQLFCETTKISNAQELKDFAVRRLYRLSNLEEDIFYDSLDLVSKIELNNVDIQSMHSSGFSEQKTKNLLVSWLINHIDELNTSIKVTHPSDCLRLGYKLKSGRTLTIKSQEDVPKHYLGPTDGGEIIVQVEEE